MAATMNMPSSPFPPMMTGSPNVVSYPGQSTFAHQQSRPLSSGIQTTTQFASGAPTASVFSAPTPYSAPTNYHPQMPGFGQSILPQAMAGPPMSHPIHTTVARGPSSYPVVTTHHGHGGAQDFGTYKPINADYVTPGKVLSGGMVPTYDQFAVPTFEAPLVVQADARTAAAPHYEVQERGVSRGVSSSVGSFSAKVAKKQVVQKKTKKPEKKGWCC